MRIGNVNGRLAILVGDGGIDVETASSGRFEADPQAVYGHWDEFRTWADGHPMEPTIDLDLQALGAPAPRPRQVLAIGLNYRDHADESGFGLQEQPAVFTKFPSCITGPFGSVALPPGSVDWEVELVAVIGRTCRNVTVDEAWSHVAGLTVGQDLSEREKQLAGSVPQFSLGKSHPCFGPMGPWLVTVDEFTNPDDLEAPCGVNGVEMQKSRTSLLIVSIPELVVYLSTIVTLLPGDVIYSGTPAGVGSKREPPQFLREGDELVSTIERIGTMVHTFVLEEPAR